MYNKKCFKCGNVKDISQFYKHQQMKDGHLNKCKECTKKDTIKNYHDNLEYYKNYEKSRATLPHRIDARKLYSKTEYGKQSHRKSRMKYITKYPNARKAHKIFSYAIKSNKITRGDSCEQCSSRTRIEGHHDDYNFPLDVRWLCCKCHHKWHKNNTPLNRV